MNIYAGNLSRQTTEDDLRRAFEPFGQVESVNIIREKLSGESNGFGFVSMPSSEEARKAIEEMNGKELSDRVIKVAEAKPRVNSPRRISGGGSRGGRQGGGGGYDSGGYGGRRGDNRRHY